MIEVGVFNKYVCDKIKEIISQYYSPIKDVDVFYTDNSFTNFVISIPKQIEKEEFYKNFNDILIKNGIKINYIFVNKENLI